MCLYEAIGILLMIILGSAVGLNFAIGFEPKLCKKVYKDLTRYKFVINDNQVYDASGLNPYFVYYLDNNSFRLSIDIFLLRGLVFLVYEQYWRRKYLKWFKENVDTRKLEIYEHYKHTNVII